MHIGFRRTPIIPKIKEWLRSLLPHGPDLEQIIQNKIPAELTSFVHKHAYIDIPAQIIRPHELFKSTACVNYQGVTYAINLHEHKDWYHLINRLAELVHETANKND